MSFHHSDGGSMYVNVPLALDDTLSFRALNGQWYNHIASSIDVGVVGERARPAMTMEWCNNKRLSLLYVSVHMCHHDD